MGTVKSLLLGMCFVLGACTSQTSTVQTTEKGTQWEWQNGTIVAKYPKPAPPYTTVASIVKNLERKQYIRAARVGNTYQYTPLIRESEYKRTFMSGFVRNYFENSYKEMVSFFAKDQKISANDLKDIIDMIEKGKE